MEIYGSEAKIIDYATSKFDAMFIASFKEKLMI